MDQDQSKTGEGLAGKDPAEEPRTAEQLRAEIQQTRSELGDTVAALAEKSDVRAQAKSAAEEAKQRVTGKVTELKETVTGKKEEFISSAQEAAPESAQDAGQRALAFVKANSAPLSVVAALFLGVMIGKKIFEQIWSLIDDRDPLEPKYRDVPLGKLAAALALEGAIFGLIRGLTDHASRHGFATLNAGEWPGDEAPPTKDD